MKQLVQAFLERYEKANSYSDWAAIGKLYADTFLFGGVNGVQVFRKAVDKKCRFFHTHSSFRSCHHGKPVLGERAAAIGG
jgi:hypothetical protein